MTVASASAEGEQPARARKKHAAPEAPESIARHVEGLASTAEAPAGCIRLVYESEWARPVVHVALGGDEDDLHVSMKVLTPHDDVVDASEVEDPAAYPKFAVIPRSTASFLISGDAADHWDNPGRRPYARYEIQSPGACGAHEASARAAEARARARRRHVRSVQRHHHAHRRRSRHLRAAKRKTHPACNESAVKQSRKRRTPEAVM